MNIICPRCTRPVATLDLCPECRAWDQCRLTGPVVALGVVVDPGEAPRQCSRAQVGMVVARTLEQRNGLTAARSPEGSR